MRALIGLPKPWIVALDNSRQSPAVCRWLRKLGAEVHLADPQALHAVAKLRNAKTDDKDAQLMLRLLISCDLPRRIWPPNS